MCRISANVNVNVKVKVNADDGGIVGISIAGPKIFTGTIKKLATNKIRTIQAKQTPIRNPAPLLPLPRFVKINHTGRIQIDHWNI
jgi:hypothetical protein